MFGFRISGCRSYFRFYMNTGDFPGGAASAAVAGVEGRFRGGFKFCRWFGSDIKASENVSAKQAALLAFTGTSAAACGSRRNQLAGKPSGRFGTHCAEIVTQALQSFHEPVGRAFRV